MLNSQFYQASCDNKCRPFPQPCVEVQKESLEKIDIFGRQFFQRPHPMPDLSNNNNQSLKSDCSYIRTKKGLDNQTKINDKKNIKLSSRFQNRVPIFLKQNPTAYKDSQQHHHKSDGPILNLNLSKITIKIDSFSTRTIKRAVLKRLRDSRESNRGHDSSLMKKRLSLRRERVYD